jgi:tetratricopeptide (TPR) repeat protein
MTLKRLVGLVVCAGMLAGAATAARAQSDKAAENAAKAYFKEGTTAYDLGDFKTAVEKYKQAYQAKQQPAFLYNIAQSYRLAGDFQQAVFFYKSYLRNAASAPNRKEVEARITDLEDQLAKQKAAEVAPPVGTQTPDGNPSDTATPGDTEGSSPGEGEPDTAIPSPDKAAAAVDTGTPEGPTDRPAHKPIYKKWWFWGGIGAVAATVVVVAVVASGGGGGAPDTTLGEFQAN